jgi:divalent metal cation (Fe/Co/Zn/Cd) transporter
VIHRDARRITIAPFASLSLAVYLVGQAILSVVAGVHPDSSPLGIGWLAATAVVMFALAFAKSITGRALAHQVLRTEAKVTVIDGVLATATLAGLALNAATGWWGADIAAGRIIVVYGLREGVHLLGPANAINKTDIDTNGEITP